MGLGEGVPTDVADRFRAVELELPGMEAALRRPAAADARDFTVALRCATNRWTVAVGEVPPGDDTAQALAAGQDAVSAAARGDAGVGHVLRDLNRSSRTGAGTRPLALVFARLELDRCGAWVSLGCAGGALPTLVRRAGWVDVRGQAGPALGAAADPVYGEDRVGLGPGDALVFASSAFTGARDAAGEIFADEALPEALLASAGAPAATLADRVLQAVADHTPDVPHATVLVLRVPDDAGKDPDARLRAALGTPGDRHLPRYPVGQAHWAPHHRPAPPRQARILLDPTPSAVPAARRFARSVLHSWRLSELADGGDVGLITSELVGNAVRHARRGVTVILAYDGHRLRVAVGDGSRALPQSRQPSADDVHGRGLLIVEALAAAVGVSPTVGGKRVWAEVDVPPAPTG